MDGSCAEVIALTTDLLASAGDGGGGEAGGADDAGTVAASTAVSGAACQALYDG